MKKKLLLGAIAFLLIGASAEAGLTVGDDAPMLTIKEWVKGEPVNLARAEGKITVVEFWATWCGPCIAGMPHLTELQKEYADKGVTIIGVTREDPNNSLEQVRDFVKDHPAKMGYTVAWDYEGKTNAAYMKAAKQNGIPTAFVVDKKGKIAWIGHPINMDSVIEKLAADTYDVDLAAKVFPVEQLMLSAQWGGREEVALKAAELILALHEEHFDAWATKMSILLRDEERKGDRIVVAKRAIDVFKDDAVALSRFAGMLANGDEPAKQLALQAGERAKTLAPENIDVRMSYFSVLSASGRHDEAVSWAEKTVQIANDDAATLRRLAGTLLAGDEAGWKLALSAAGRAKELEPENMGIRLAYFGALALNDRREEAQDWAAETIETAEGDASDLGRIARALSDGKHAGSFGDLALRAIDGAIEAEPDESAHVENKFRILAVCKKDREAAEAAAKRFLELADDDSNALNAFSWQLLTDDEFGHEFNDLALAAAERCHVASGGENWMYLDTLALAEFETGSIEEAVEHEKKAIEHCPTDPTPPDLLAALKRFEVGK